MSRTFRNAEGSYHYYLRHPKTHNELSKLDEILHDVELMDYPISGINHLKSREHSLPSAWDDRVESAYYELYYTNK